MLAASYQSQQNNVAQVNNQQPTNTDPNNMLQQQQQPTTQTLRLRDDPPPITPAAPRNSRKRKTPPSVNNDQTSQQQSQQQHQHQTPPIATVQHSLPPTHTMVHPPPPHMQAHTLPQGYQYDYSTGGMPVPPAPDQSQVADHDQSQSPPNTAAGRALSSSKRAEQNRKAQRAFRERRDQHVKALESRSQLLDAALASADEANRRWEECRALVDQLRLENTALRNTLSSLQIQPPGGGGGPSNNNGAHAEWDDIAARI